MSRIETILLPDIGEGVVEGEVVAWLKAQGERVEKDEPVVEVMTDKATVQLPSPFAGVLAKQHYPEGGIAIKGQPLYDVEVEGEEEKEQKQAPKREEKKQIERPARHVAQQGGLAIPALRHFAAKMGVDLRAVPATGTHGEVTWGDLRKFLRKGEEESAKGPSFPDDEVEPIRGVRRLVAEKMRLSKRTIPHFSLCDRADASYLLQVHDRLRKTAQEEGVALPYTPIFLRALSLTIEKFPQINATVQGGNLVLHKRQNIGIATKSKEGLIVPVLKDVQGKSLREVAHTYHAFRQKKYTPEDMRGSTITLSNFGTEGGLWATPVINVPEVAILATAKISDQVVAHKGESVIGPALNCSWSFDHRVIDGDLASAVSRYFISLIENPSRIL